MFQVSDTAMLRATARFDASGTPRDPAQVHRWELRGHRVDAHRNRLVAAFEIANACLQVVVSYFVRTNLRQNAGIARD